MKLGMVGLPNVGKSTLFNALTNAGAESANYPFCTIEPNVGIVSVPDERLDKLRDMYKPEKFTPPPLSNLWTSQVSSREHPRVRDWETSSLRISARWTR